MENARAGGPDGWPSDTRTCPNIVWSMTPEAKDEFVPVLRELAAGLREGDGGATSSRSSPTPPRTPPASSTPSRGSTSTPCKRWKGRRADLPHGDEGLQPQARQAGPDGGRRLRGGPEYGFEVTPLWVRRQAYYSYLAGAHHTYGHNDSWRVLPTWKKALDAPGAVADGHSEEDVFMARTEWWLLVPDQSVCLGGGAPTGSCSAWPPGIRTASGRSSTRATRRRSPWTSEGRLAEVKAAGSTAARASARRREFARGGHSPSRRRRGGRTRCWWQSRLTRGQFPEKPVPVQRNCALPCLIGLDGAKNRKQAGADG